MSFEVAIFYVLALLAVVPAVLVVTVKNVFHSALWLVLSLSAVGGIFAMLAADFLFAVQLLVYAGGIMVVLLFVVLLSGKPSDWTTPQVNEKSLAAAIFSVFFVAVIVTTLNQWALNQVPVEAQPTTARLGRLLIEQMLLPVELVGLVLVAALIGAIYFSSKRTTV